MTQLITPADLSLVERFAARDTLMAFDYDGTLAPIVEDPAAAYMRPKTREALRELARRCRVVVITGRSRRDAMRLLSGIQLAEVIGNHGIEAYGAAPKRLTLQVTAWLNDLRARLAAWEGIYIEDKRFSIAIHYRTDPAAETAVYRAAQSCTGARLVPGKSVLNVVPAEAPNKGATLLRLCRKFGCPRALFVGDDDTDEDVFALGMPDQVLGIRVGYSGESAAAYALPGQTDVDALLEMLCVRLGRAGEKYSNGPP
jgi:trehalose 6-phosphate phosphatase